ncbi:2ad7daa2-1af1-4a28-b100-2fb471847840 [Sclerotinia trifoliorum]|uniref:2ad7daa2-1af1-4a28-b100-2fb471847840 n=1 Tax=Sclerotinia trifoliorum TaxID=28548 RepID=A0A8H2W2E5_9HELO|nr:2ad7daa2-1af1-4a28-b100-2fb471847840 [Sclerotinia trifoliorum]
MDSFLGKITQQAMTYAIRSGIGITASFAIRQTSRLLKTVDNSGDYRELHELQQRLDSKIRIVSPAIDMIELISARGNTTLESAVTLTKSLRWEIQSLGMKLAKAASAEEFSRRNKNRVKTRASHEAEIRAIVRDIKKLLTRIEDAVPLINLAITTSGANLSTTLPETVSPSRLLQASNLLAQGDAKYGEKPNISVQIGPTLTLSLYMLFAGHAYRAQDEEGMRETTWKEVIHKAKVKLLRVPLRSTYGSSGQLHHSNEAKDYLTGKDSSLIAGEGKASEYAYQLEIIEDFDDDRVHSYEDGEPQPGPYGGVKLAGIREHLPIHQISKIFYADTGKILNIGNQDEANSPVLLLKRDINAMPPRRMMEGHEVQSEWYDEGGDMPSEEVSEPEEEEPKQEEEDEEDDDLDIDEQLRRESMAPESPSEEVLEIPQENTTWRLPQNLDPEWLALEVYTEAVDSESEDELEPERNGDSASISSRPKTSGEHLSTNDLTTDLSNLKISSPAPATPSSQAHLPSHPTSPMPVSSSPSKPRSKPQNKGLQIPIQTRSSLSLLEMLIRLTSLQQFQQSTHLAVPDEFLTFFLHESSTTGAGGDASERKRTRMMARKKVGFDPYDESPVKRHGESYQYGEDEGHDRHEREGTPWDEDVPSNPRGIRERSSTPQRSLASPARFGSDIRQSRETSSPTPSSPISPYKPKSQPYFQQRQGFGYRGRDARVDEKSNGGPLDKVHRDRGEGRASPLRRGGSVETEKSLGMSAGSPELVVSKHESGE